MSVYHVPQPDWPEFIRRFAADHAGQRVMIEKFTLRSEPEGAAASAKNKVVKRNVPLREVICSGEAPVTVRFRAGEGDGQVETFTLNDPVQIRLEIQPHRHELVVESRNRETLLLHFPPSRSPEEMDGLP